MVKNLKSGRDIVKMNRSDITNYYFRNVPPYYKPLKVLWMRNGCCPGHPVILTVNELKDGTKNYSCQCECNGWCTTGTSSEEEAIDHYKRMSAGENLYGGGLL